MDRATKYFTIGSTNVPQPAFGTTLAAAFVFTSQKDGFGNPYPLQKMILADASWLLPQDKIIVVETDGTSADILKIISIAGNLVTVQPFDWPMPKDIHSHASGAWVILDQSCAAVYIQGKDGAAGDIGVGLSMNVNLTTGVSLLRVLKPVASGSQPPDFSSGNVYGANPQSTGQYWLVGTAGDYYLPGLVQT